MVLISRTHYKVLRGKYRGTVRKRPKNTFKPTISPKFWNHEEGAREYINLLEKRGYEGRVFQLAPKVWKVEYRKKRQR